MSYYIWNVYVSPFNCLKFNRFHKAWCERYGNGDHSRTEICIYGVIKKEYNNLKNIFTQ
jgi:hypothetical protein